MNRLSDKWFFSPFESGYRPYTGWRWYYNFLKQPGMVMYVESDTWDCLIDHGLVTA